MKIECLIQVFIPNLNGKKYLNKTIESILSQSYTNFEVILVDNNSNDDSVFIFNSYNDNRFSVLKFETRVSLAENLNRCIDAVTAPFFCIMHTDDIYAPDYLKILITTLNQNAHSLIAHCDVKTINYKGIPFFNFKYWIKSINLNKKKYSFLQGTNGIIKLYKFNPIIAPSVMYRREVIEKVDKFNKNQKFVVDWDYYFRILLKNYSIVKVHQSLFYYRLHDLQQTNDMTKDLKKYEEMVVFKKRILLLLQQNFSKSVYNVCKIYKTPPILSTLFVDFILDLFHLHFKTAIQKCYLFIKIINNNFFYDNTKR